MVSASKKELILLSAYAIANNFSEGTINFLVTQIIDQEYEQNNITEQVREILYADGTTNKIAAIKKHRELTGFGLKESKEWVEQTFKV